MPGPFKEFSAVKRKLNPRMTPRASSETRVLSQRDSLRPHIKEVLLLEATEQLLMEAMEPPQELLLLEAMEPLQDLLLLLELLPPKPYMIITLA
jgi:hypothetical protein